MSDNGDKYPSQFSKAQGDVHMFLVLSETQRDILRIRNSLQLRIIVWLKQLIDYQNS